MSPGISRLMILQKRHDTVRLLCRAGSAGPAARRPGAMPLTSCTRRDRDAWNAAEVGCDGHHSQMTAPGDQVRYCPLLTKAELEDEHPCTAQTLRRVIQQLA